MKRDHHTTLYLGLALNAMNDTAKSPTHPHPTIVWTFVDRLP